MENRVKSEWPYAAGTPVMVYGVEGGDPAFRGGKPGAVECTWHCVGYPGTEYALVRFDGGWSRARVVHRDQMQVIPFTKRLQEKEVCGRLRGTL